MKIIRVLFICMGNICRSPTAEAVFRARVEEAGLWQQILIDSAGTRNYSGASVFLLPPLAGEGWDGGERVR